MRQEQSPVNLEAHGLACWRGERLLFHDLSFTLGSGDHMCLSGPNGSGKSSLLEILAGILEPDRGHIKINGLSARPGDVFWLGSVAPFYRDLSVFDNLLFWAKLNGFSRNETLDALIEFNLATLVDVRVCFLSIGQQQRLHLARLKLTQAPVWLLDEPLTSLDMEGEKTAITLIHKHLCKGGIAITAPPIHDIPHKICPMGNAENTVGS